MMVALSEQLSEAGVRWQVL